jgi:hypothetical protein
VKRESAPPLDAGFALIELFCVILERSEESRFHLARYFYGRGGRPLGGRWHHFRRETHCRDYSAITCAARSVMEVLILLSGSAVNPEIDG